MMELVIVRLTLDVSRITNYGFFAFSRQPIEDRFQFQAAGFKRGVVVLARHPYRLAIEEQAP